MNQNQFYDKYKRDRESRRFYKSKAWKKCRKLVLIRDNHLCQNCFKKGKLTAADMVHHIEELKDKPELALNEDNLISLCNTCHNKEHPDKAYKGKHKKKPKRKIRVIESNANDEVT
ncbi:HNH endonuclease [Fictibacillus sp. JL2B1089]|uniref:HNH endonuclease n=1 Tax=Fictibacillus sp. JL2B1089 TaxID=3399565 RepID=UPI003A8AC408